MSKHNSRVTVDILDKEYQVACPDNERLALQSAARELDDLMRKVRNTGTVIGTDRIAVMVALNLCHELQRIRSSGSLSTDIKQKLQQLNHMLDDALSETGQQ